jgi:hypothetical protein
VGATAFCVETASSDLSSPWLNAGGTAMKIFPHFVHLTFEPLGFNRISFKLNRVEQFLHSMIIATQFPSAEPSKPE